MATKIEWTDETWNPVTGCTKVSDGCDHCYAETLHERFNGKGSFATVQLNEVRLTKPLSWRKPRKVFVNSMSDLFHDKVPDEYIARVFAVMALTSQHTYQLLTKRHARMRSLLSDLCRCGAGHPPGVHFRSQMAWAVSQANPDRIPGVPDDAEHRVYHDTEWPLPNVMLGVSVENQQWADIRIPALLKTPAAVRFLSCEPLLGPVDLTMVDFDGATGLTVLEHPPNGIDWVIVGGESGRGARPMHPDWARKLRDQCQAARVPFLFKQWGAWAPAGKGIGTAQSNAGREVLVGPPLDDMGHRQVMRLVGKGNAGRELDGRTWDEFPAVAQ